MKFNIHVSKDASEVMPLWRDFEENGAMTPFQTRAWLLPLFDTLARDMRAEPLFVTVRDSDGAPILFLPLCRRRHFGANVVQFPDFGVSDYNAPLMSRERILNRDSGAEILRLLVRALGKANALRLEKMPSQVQGVDNPLAQFSNVQPIASQSWGFDLPSTPQDYCKTVAASFLKEIRRKQRRAAGRGDVAFVQAKSAVEKAETFDILVRQRQARCDEMGRFHLLSDNRFRNFYEKMIHRDVNNEFALLHALKVKGETVATALSLRHPASRFILMTTFEAGDWKSCSLGNLVLFESIVDSIAKGDTFFDLTIGNESYKSDFGAVARPLYSVTRALNFIGLPHVAFRAAAIAVRKTAMAESLQRAFARS